MLGTVKYGASVCVCSPTAIRMDYEVPLFACPLLGELKRSESAAWSRVSFCPLRIISDFFEAEILCHTIITLKTIVLEKASHLGLQTNHKILGHPVIINRFSHLHISKLRIIHLSIQGLMQRLNPPLSSTGVLYGCHFMPWLLYFSFSFLFVP